MRALMLSILGSAALAAFCAATPAKADWYVGDPGWRHGGHDGWHRGGHDGWRHDRDWDGDRGWRGGYSYGPQPYSYGYRPYAYAPPYYYAPPTPFSVVPRRGTCIQMINGYTCY